MGGSKPTSAELMERNMFGGSGTGILAIIALSMPIAYFHVTADTALFRQIWLTLGLSVVGYFLTVFLIPVMGWYTARRGLCGIDLNKPGAKEDKKPVPESLGIVCGTVYLILIIFIQLQFTADDRTLLQYTAALHSIGFMVFLGFADDVLDLPWRYKMLLPSVATLPLLVSYAGLTTIAVPIQLRHLLGGFVDIGILYYVYMGLLAVFTTNAINIYAGINGLEAGQSFIIGLAVLGHNILELNGPAGAHHLFSMHLIIPFLLVTLALLKFNWFPSRVFVGDCFCYFAGMTFAVVGISGHFSKTLLLFFIPQIVNFLLSIPQLIGIIHCPRHRLPRLNAKTGKLEATPNGNMVNVVLMVTGPLKEDTFCLLLLILQTACCALGFFVRYFVAGYFY